MMKDKRFENLDEHDMPTEPMAQVVFSPVVPHFPVDPAAIPAPQPQERPFPQNQYGAPPPFGVTRAPESVYPYLPPAPVMNGARPVGGATQDWTGSPAQPVRPVKMRRSAWPTLVGLFFVAVQLLLLVRFVIDVISLSRSTPWVDIVYNLSSVFILPFRLFLSSISLPVSISVELYTVLAILVYGLFSRLLVRFLKAVLNSR